jgi:glycosyltransferase involved in cell wall biosynthesis
MRKMPYPNLGNGRNECTADNKGGTISPIRLVHVTTAPVFFGFLTGQIGYMKSRDVAVHALSSPGEYLETFGAREQIPVHSVDMPRRITPLRDMVALVRIWRCLRRIRPDLIHAHTPKGGLLGILGAWLARVPVRIYHVHGLPFLTATGYKRLLLRWSERISCLFAHQVLCVSHSIREVAIRERLCAPAKIKVLREGSINGIDAEEKFRPARDGDRARKSVREEYGIGEDALVIGFIGRMVRDKGLSELVHAWKLLREEYPGAHLLVVGPYEPQDPIPADVNAALIQDPRVYLVGLEWNTRPLYAAMDVFVLPTYREGFPIVPLEAAAMELPVVATSVPGCVDAVRHGVTGTLVPPYDAEALATAIRAYLDDPALRRRHGEAARRRVLRDFRPGDMWEAVYEEYTRLTQSAGRRRGTLAAT